MLSYLKKIISLVLCLVLAGSFYPKNSFSQETKKIAVILSADIEPYQDALSGFKEGIKSAAYKISYKEFVLTSSNSQEIANDINFAEADLIFAVGTQASLFVKDDFNGTPIVFSMVLDPVENNIVKSLDRPGKNITGVSLNIPVEEQFEVFKLLVPSIKKIGMLYDAKTRSNLEKEASGASGRMNIKLVSKPVHTQKDISKLLNEVLNESDGLWAGVDPVIYNSTTAQQIILSTLQRKIPFMALSKNFVKAGALVALECDYFDNGKQAGEMAIGVIKGKDISSFRVRPPRKKETIINSRTAETIGLEINRKVFSDATII